jgi:hypothetical protein
MRQHQIFVLKPYFIADCVLLSWYLIGRLVERFFGFCPPFLSLFLSLTDSLVRSIDLDACQVGQVA